MSFIDLFLSFSERILSFQILGYPIYSYLITITIVSIAFSIIGKMIHSKEE